MITKLSTFRGITTDGEPLNRVFHPGDSITKVAGRMVPEIQDWLRTFKSDKENIAVLVSAMGATEYWGGNSNGDHFRWGPLSHDCRKHDHSHPKDDFTGKVIPPYGYWTFHSAHPFAHHKNKDPKRAFGSVPLAVLNRDMRRVELVVLVNREKAAQHGGQSIVDRIDAGEFPDVSMGCRVPYDVCLICGNKSKTRNDYCDCINRLGMGTILDDGRVVGVDNPHPRFFDISFVFIGADKTAKVMVKLGSGLWVPSSVIEGEILYGPDGEGLTKAACGMRCGQCPDKESCGKIEMLKEARDRRRSIDHGQIKAANGDDDAGRAPTDEEKKQIVHFIKTTKPITDEKFHEFMEAKGINPHKGEKVVYEALQKTAEVRVGPPPKPNRKEYPFVGTIQYKGLTIHVENKRGDVREGMGPGGKKWRTHMLHHYGEILGTRGTDRDKLDVYVGPEPNAKEVYVIHQNHPGNHPSKAGKYDEDKVMLGFASPDAAKEAYLKHYDRKDFFRSMTTIPFNQFKEMIMGEVKGEKVAMEKTAVKSPELEDLFSHPNIVRRERTWRNKVTGEETNHVGSGLGTRYATMQKTAGVDDLKVAALKNAEQKKWAEIIKRIDPEADIGRVAKVLSEREDDIPDETLDEMAKMPMGQCLATPSAMGMALKPREFQRIVLIRMGHRDMADDLDSRGETFEPSEKSLPLGEFGSKDVSPELMKLLLPLLMGRSYFGPALHRRVIRIRITPKKEDGEKTASSPILDKVAEAYTWYRGEMLKVAAESAMDMAPEVRAGVCGIGDEELFKEGMTLPTAVGVGSIPLTLLYSSHWRGQQRAGMPMGPLKKFVAEHPMLSSLGGAVGLRTLLRSGGRAMKDALKEAPK